MTNMQRTMERSSARIACCSTLRENTQRVLKRLVMLAKDDEEGYCTQAALVLCAHCVPYAVMQGTTLIDRLPQR